MIYLSPSEYQSFGLDDTTPSAIVTVACSLIDAHCNRPTIGIAEYTERLRISPANTVRLTYLPLTNQAVPAPADGGIPHPPPPDMPAPFISVRVRYASFPFTPLASDLSIAVAQAFSLPGSWTDLDPLSLDCDVNTGDVTLPANLLGIPYAEAEFVYHAGYSAAPQAVKAACAQVVQNALATPALNVRASSIERMHMDYFSDSLLTSDVRKLLAPYIAHRV
jgi:hypothetical protein